MFSAINWKGKHKECLGIIVVDGAWTRNTLEIMSQVFDYVIPVEKSHEVAQKIQRQFIVQFRVVMIFQNMIVI